MFKFNKNYKKEYLLFISENKKMMYKIAFGYLQNESKSLEAIDEAVYLGYVHLKDLKEIKYLKTWFIRILINECLKILRKSKREVFFENANNLFLNSYEVEENSINLKIAIHNLPEKLKDIIILRYFGGYTISETSEILKIPEGTVATHSKRALKLLRIDLTE